MLLYILQTAVLAFVIAVLLAPIVIEKLRRLHFGQKILEDGPTWHKGKQNTPTMGGVIFILAMGLAVLTCLPRMIAEEDFRPLVMLGLSLIFAAVGFADDWTKIKKKQNQGLTAKQKLLLQIAAAVLFLVVMRVMGYLPAAFYIPFFGVTWRLPWWLYLVISLTDGIDGLCSSVTLIVAVFFALVMLRDGNLGSAFALALAGGLLGFFLFNKHPAKVFMGDTGSLFLGGAVCRWCSSPWAWSIFWRRCLTSSRWAISSSPMASAFSKWPRSIIIWSSAAGANGRSSLRPIC